MTELDISVLGMPSTRLRQLLQNGEEIVLADEGKPIARVVPLDPKRPVFNTFKGRAVIADDFDAPLPPDILAEFEK